MKKILKYILTFIVVIAIFVVALVLSSLFPRDLIQANVEKSSKELIQETIPTNVLGVWFDNATDILMINTSYSINPKKPLESALLTRVDYLPDKEQTVYEDIGTGNDVVPNEGYNPIEQLTLTVKNEIDESYEYARYWHGYISFLRPLFIFFSFNEIRKIMIVVLALLAMILLMVLYKKISFKYCFAVLLALLTSEYFLMGFTLQGIMTFIICMISSIIICTRFEKIKNIGVYFFVIGMVTCYFDLLTHPIITLGFPMIIYLLLKQEKEQMSLKETIKFIIVNTLLWGIGWIVTNIAKWVIVDILYDRNLIYKSIMQFGYRSQAEYTAGLNLFDGLKINWKYAIKNTYTYYAILLIYVICYLIKNYKKINIDIKSGLPYLIIALMPIAWFVVMRNHTLNHWYFTWRNLIVFYIGTGIFLLKLFSIKGGNSNKTEGVEITENQKGNEVK